MNMVNGSMHYDPATDQPGDVTVTLVVSVENAKRISAALDEQTNRYLEHGVQTDYLDEWATKNDRLAGVVRNITRVACENADCDCGHTLSWHQSGDGAWTGFCSASASDSADWPESYPGVSPSEACACEGFRKLEGYTE